MAKTITVAQAGAYLEVSDEKILTIAQAGAYIEVSESFPANPYGPKIQIT